MRLCSGNHVKASNSPHERPENGVAGSHTNELPDRIKQIPVWVACDRQGQVTDAVLRHISAEELYSHLQGRVEPETPLVADAHLAHEAVASQLKVWINGTFRGEASRYLYRYLGWRRLLSGNILTGKGFIEGVAGHWVNNC